MHWKRNVVAFTKTPTVDNFFFKLKPDMVHSFTFQRRNILVRTSAIEIFQRNLVEEMEIF